ncbi:hypothetical protein NLM27_40465 [Bradyrhizobium sp. CCGB12]|uniref:hypothetical protein n=1 Tax=Bradyrhizobium sp. CCGB12 TaxID=2949632 RepID=UPI0020B248C4|nr:hypothetical protein [Bradyrhizobium sp. CCGB12]MCP3395025.1 hypothetical protein [Bradyrhizobium sp. CCGB12]
MDHNERQTAIQARIAEQIETIAQAICEGRDPITEQRLLQALEAQLAAEEVTPSRHEAVDAEQNVRKRTERARQSSNL